MRLFNLFNKKFKKRNENLTIKISEDISDRPSFQKDIHYEASSQKGPKDG